MSSTRRPLAALLTVSLWTACGASPDEVARNLSSPNPVVKEDSAKIADNFDSPEVRAALVVALQDPSERTRLNAIESLVELEAKEGVPGLILVVQQDPSDRVKGKAIDALGRLKDPAAVPVILEYILAHDAAKPPLNAIWALGFIEDNRALPVLAPLLDSPDPYIAWNARQALRSIHPSGATPEGEAGAAASPTASPASAGSPAEAPPAAPAEPPPAPPAAPAEEGAPPTPVTPLPGPNGERYIDPFASPGEPNGPPL
jgi:hypothetical protein